MNVVGALMYLAIGTQPDITYTVGKLMQFNNNPGQTHWQAIKHVFHYINGTMDLKLMYHAKKSCSSPHPFITYSDSDHAGCLNTQYSTGGYVVKIGMGAVSWSSRKQAMVALSSTEAQYIASVAAGKEILWMHTLLGELQYKVNDPSPMIMDNKSAPAVVKNPEHHGRMKHLHINYHWICQVIHGKQVLPSYILTEEMTANIFTKVFPHPLIE